MYCTLVDHAVGEIFLTDRLMHGKPWLSLSVAPIFTPLETSLLVWKSRAGSNLKDSSGGSRSEKWEATPVCSPWPGVALWRPSRPQVVARGTHPPEGSQWCTTVYPLKPSRRRCPYTTIQTFFLYQDQGTFTDSYQINRCQCQCH